MRLCYRCGRAIYGCNGFVLAGDFLAAVKRDIPWKKVRELCWMCVEKAGTELDEGNLSAE